jgi:hypothetical protein
LQKHISKQASSTTGKDKFDNSDKGGKMTKIRGYSYLVFLLHACILISCAGREVIIRSGSLINPVCFGKVTCLNKSIPAKIDSSAFESKTTFVDKTTSTLIFYGFGYSTIASGGKTVTDQNDFENNILKYTGGKPDHGVNDLSIQIRNSYLSVFVPLIFVNVWHLRSTTNIDITGSAFSVASNNKTKESAHDTLETKNGN